MIKSVFKEIVIILLLCVAILLILGVLFYDFIPSNNYDPGKKDPFSMQAEEANNQATNGTQNNGSQGSTGNTNTNTNINTNTGDEEEIVNTNSDPNSTGTFFEDDGRK